jgi:hydroxyacylglutathione hydrolase
MFFKQFTVEGMGCLSYLIGCPQARIACVVDPKRDVQDYIETARKNGMKITHIFETHIHADHVSGNRELQSRTGADIYFMEGTPARFPHKEVKDGETMDLGMVSLKFIKTPGHTPQHMSIVVTDRSRAEEPWFVLTGDCPFVGDVGRPDLAGEELLEEQVRNLYESLHEKLGSLPEGMEIFPAHGEGSLCGKGMSSKPSSTIGFEKRANPVFSLGWEEFHREFTTNFPERPRGFSHIISTNMEGPPLLERCPVTRDLTPRQVKAEMERGAVVLDARDSAAFGGVHIPGSINIGLAPQMANWVSAVIDPQAELVLVVQNREDYDAMVTQLHRIGYDRIIGYLDGGIIAWQGAGYPLNRLYQISAHELKEKLDTGDYDYVYDVRTKGEYDSGHIQGVEHLPLGQLLTSPPDIPKDKEVIVICGSGYRGNIAASYLQGMGFSHVHSLAGGMKAWMAAGFPVVRD